MRHLGGCHCGAVRFEVDAVAKIVAHDCNCSICRLCRYQHLIVPVGNFRLICGDGGLLQYQFNSRTARHMFCGRCGIKSFYFLRSHPEGVSVNVRCLESSSIASMRLVAFDGQNWETSIEQITLAMGLLIDAEGAALPRGYVPLTLAGEWLPAVRFILPQGLTARSL